MGYKKMITERLNNLEQHVAALTTALAARETLLTTAFTVLADNGLLDLGELNGAVALSAQEAENRGLENIAYMLRQWVM